MSRCRRGKSWVAERQDQIERFYRPGCGLQLNPKERLNVDLKPDMGKRLPLRANASLREAANEHITCLNAPRTVFWLTFRIAGSGMPLDTSPGLINKAWGMTRVNPDGN